MNFLTSLLIAIGLATDAFAVSLTSGAIIKKVHLKHALLYGMFFGVFQMLMPIIGWGVGAKFRNVITGWDHWIAFILLAVVGGHMIKEAFSESDKPAINPLDLKVLLTLAIATSIDALAVGFGLSLVSSDLLMPIIIIGVVTFILSFAGVYLGRLLGHILNKKVECLGGLVLIGIGIKILIDHLS